MYRMTFVSYYSARRNLQLRLEIVLSDYNDMEAFNFILRVHAYIGESSSDCCRVYCPLSIVQRNSYKRLGLIQGLFFNGSNGWQWLAVCGTFAPTGRSSAVLYGWHHKSPRCWARQWAELMRRKFGHLAAVTVHGSPACNTAPTFTSYSSFPSILPIIPVFSVATYLLLLLTLFIYHTSWVCARLFTLQGAFLAAASCPRRGPFNSNRPHPC